MNKKNERGGVHDPTLAEEQAAAHFSLEDMLLEAEKQTGRGDTAGREGEAMATKRQIAANRKNAKRSTGPRTSTGKARSAMNATRHGLLGEFHLIEGEDPQEFYKFEEGTRAALKPESTVEEYFVDRFIKDAWLLNRLDNVELALVVNKESLDDLSIDDLMKVLVSLHHMGLQFFDRIPELERHLYGREASNDRNMQTTAQNKSNAGSTWDTKSAFAVESSTAALGLAESEVVFGKNLNARLLRMNLGTNRPQATCTPAETEGERGAPPTEEATNTMARAFSRHRAAIALVLRYRAKIERSRDSSLHELQRFQAARQGQVVSAPEVVDVNVNFTGKKKDRN